MWGQPISLTNSCLNNFSRVLYTRTTKIFSSNSNYIRVQPYSFPHTGISVALPSQVFCSRQRKPFPNFSNTDAHNNPANDSDEEDSGKKSNSTGEILKRLKKYGMSGILSYGLLNTTYYLPTFLFVWLYVAPAPGKMGYLSAVERFLKTFAMVWAGSQVTKIARAAGALALAPVVERGLSWFTVKFKFESQGKAFMVRLHSMEGAEKISKWRLSGKKRDASRRKNEDMQVWTGD